MIMNYDLHYHTHVEKSKTVIGQSKCYASELIRLSCANIKQLCVKLEEESKQRMGSTGGT